MSAEDEQQVKRYMQQMLACTLQERQAGYSGGTFDAILKNQFDLSCYWQRQHIHDFGALRNQLFRK
ncbi:hypothetical protein B0919_11700 [Hymenobacter sp. CRA2]|nr:hypothetical protein B0919_11700 [Hymenobacter sp. CRA2]